MTDERGTIKRSDLCITSGLTIRPHEMGKIKIGRLGAKRKSKAGNDYQQPEKLDYFTITHKNRDDSGNFVVDQEAMHAVGEAKPRRLRVFLPYQDPNLNLVVFYGAYVKSRCMCRGNGQIALRFDKDKNQYSQIDCPGNECRAYKNKKCKLNGILNVILADIPRIGGVHVFRTTSFYSIESLRAAMSLFLMQTEGNIAGIPLELVIRPEVKQPEDGTKVTIYTVNLEFVGTLESLRKSALALAENHAQFRNRLALAEGTIRKALEAATSVPPDEEDPAAVHAEFYPDENPERPTTEDDFTMPAKPARDIIDGEFVDEGDAHQDSAPDVDEPPVASTDKPAAPAPAEAKTTADDDAKWHASETARLFNLILQEAGARGMDGYLIGQAIKENFKNAVTLSDLSLAQLNVLLAVIEGKVKKAEAAPAAKTNGKGPAPKTDAAPPTKPKTADDLFGGDSGPEGDC